MSDLQVSNTFLNGQTVDASQFNTNYSDITTYVNAKNSASSAWDAFYMTSSSNVATFNNSSGTQDIAQFKDNSTNVMFINDGGIVSMPFQYYGRMYFSTSQTVPSAGQVSKITFDTGTQTVSAFSNGTFTAPANGKYLIGCSLTFPLSNPAGGVLIGPGVVIYKNGAEFSRRLADEDQTNSYSVSITDILALSAGNTIEIYQTCIDGVGAFTLTSSSSSNFLFIVKLS